MFQHETVILSLLAIIAVFLFVTLLKTNSVTVITGTNVGVEDGND